MTLSGLSPASCGLWGGQAWPPVPSTGRVCGAAAATPMCVKVFPGSHQGLHPAHHFAFGECPKLTPRVAFCSAKASPVSVPSLGAARPHSPPRSLLRQFLLTPRPKAPAPAPSFWNPLSFHPFLLLFHGVEWLYFPTLQMGKRSPGVGAMERPYRSGGSASGFQRLMPFSFLHT